MSGDRFRWQQQENTRDPVCDDNNYNNSASQPPKQWANISFSWGPQQKGTRYVIFNWNNYCFVHILRAETRKDLGKKKQKKRLPGDERMVRGWFRSIYSNAREEEEESGVLK